MFILYNGDRMSRGSISAARFTVGYVLSST